MVSWMPWWCGVALALVSYFLLSYYVTQIVEVVPPGPGQAAHVVTDTLLKFCGTLGQYLLPPLFLSGALVSAFRQRRRAKLLANAAVSPVTASLVAISWQEFEILVGEAFRLRGYRVVENGGGGPDGGIDLVLHKSGETFLVQCKQWKAFKVGVQVVRELFGVMAAKGATGGFVVTSGKFTDEAKGFAKGRNIDLIDGPALHAMIRESRHALEEGNGVASTLEQPHANNDTPLPTCPVCSRTMILRKAKRGTNVGQEFWGCAEWPMCKGIRQID
jgi:restriction system protein